MTMNPACTIFFPKSAACWYSTLVRACPRGTENGDLALVRIRREEAERVAQFAHGGLDDAHVAGVFHVGQEFQRVLDDVGDFGFVVAAALNRSVLQSAFSIRGRRRASGRSFCSWRQNNFAAHKSNPRFLRIDIGGGKTILRAHLFASNRACGFVSPKKGSEFL
jgi:hypothetical protein